MASKRKSIPENPPPASSSDSESSEELTDTEQQNPPRNQSQNPIPSDSSNSTDSEEEEEEEEQKIEENKKPPSEKTAKPQSDSEETGSDTESSESAMAPTAPASKIQPKYDAGKTQKTAQSPNVLTSNSAPAKKTISDEKKSNANESQKKVKPENGGVEEKSLSFVRIWSEDDELALLRGMEEFPRKFGCGPLANRDNFLEFIKKSLKFEVTKNQLMEKIRRLRMKYERHAKKGGDPVISKPHELKLFELSKKVWSGANVESSAKAEKRKVVKTEDGEKSNKKAKRNVKVEKSLNCVKENGDLGDNLKSDPERFFDAYPFYKEALENENSGSFSKEGMRAVMVELTKLGAAKAKEMEDKWRAFHVKEMELKLFRLEIVKEQTKLVLDALKSGQPEVN